MPRPKYERNAQIMALRDDGMMLKHIAERVGTSTSNVHRVVRRETRLRNPPPVDPHRWDAELHPRLARGVARILKLEPGLDAAAVARLCARQDDLWWARQMHAEKDWLGPRRLVQLLAWAARHGHPIPLSRDGFPRECEGFRPTARRVYEPRA